MLNWPRPWLLCDFSLLLHLLWLANLGQPGSSGVVKWKVKYDPERFRTRNHSNCRRTFDMRPVTSNTDQSTHHRTRCPFVRMPLLWRIDEPISDLFNVTIYVHFTTALGKCIVNKKDRWDSGKPARLHKPPLWHIDYRGNTMLANICIIYTSPTT